MMCPNCKAKLHSYDSRQRGAVRKRSYKCLICGTKVYTTEKIDYVKRSVP